MGLPWVSLPAFSSSCLHQIPLRTPWTHTAPQEPLLDANKHLPHCPHYTDEETEAQGSQRVAPPDVPQELSRCLEGQQAGQH